MTRTNRTPTDVMRDATWGAFEGGWRDRLGADADHLKTPDDIEALESCQRAFGAWKEASWNDLSKGLGSTGNHATDELPQRVFWLAWQNRLLHRTGADT